MNETSPIILKIDELDKQVDQWWERWRGVPEVDRLFYAASNLGDFSLIWHIVGGIRAVSYTHLTLPTNREV